MKKILMTAAGGILAVSIVSACQNTALPPQEISQLPAKSAAQPAAEEHTDEAPRIDLADAKKDFDAGNAVFIDTRNEDSYKFEHIKGAVNIPFNMLEAKLNTIPKDKKIIAYCS